MAGLGYTFGKSAPVAKADGDSEAVRRLQSFLDANEPGLVRLLVRFWGDQGKAITYRELREAILRGDISGEFYEQWMQDYSRFITQYMEPRWFDAMGAGASAAVGADGWTFNPMADGVARWVQTHAAELVTNVTTTQIDGLRTLIKMATSANASVDNLAHAIRPMVGLTRPQAAANMRYYTRLIENGVKPRTALDKAMKYAGKQHRYRAQMISRTELSFAYNKGADMGVRQAQAEGYLGRMVKEWSTATIDRRCEQCAALEGKRVAMDEPFKVNGESCFEPPLHPNCMCAVMYKNPRYL